MASSSHHRKPSRIPWSGWRGARFTPAPNSRTRHRQLPNGARGPVRTALRAAEPSSLSFAGPAPDAQENRPRGHRVGQALRSYRAAAAHLLGASFLPVAPGPGNGEEKVGISGPAGGPGPPAVAVGIVHGVPHGGADGHLLCPAITRFKRPDSLGGTVEEAVCSRQGRPAGPQQLSLITRKGR